MITRLRNPAKKVRAVWISDTHLGLRSCKADRLYDFLIKHDADTIYLVGDLFDGKSAFGKMQFNQTKHNIVHLLFEKAHHGTRVIYIPGNHDELARNYVGLEWDHISIRRSAVHRTAKGLKLWVLHGDEFDVRSHWPKWLNALAGEMHDKTVVLSYWLNVCRKRLGQSYWSFFNYLQSRSRRAEAMISFYEEKVAQAALMRGYDGVICGHIHKPAVRKIGPTAYYNTGDWVEHCTALVEDAFGDISLVDWNKDIDIHEEWLFESRSRSWTFTTSRTAQRDLPCTGSRVYS